MLYSSSLQPKYNFSRWMHPLNASFLISEIVFAKLTFLKFSSPSNISSPIEVIFAFMMIVPSLVHPLKALSPRYSTDFGKVIEIGSPTPIILSWNASDAIPLILSPSIILVFLHPRMIIEFDFLIIALQLFLESYSSFNEDTDIDSNLLHPSNEFILIDLTFFSIEIDEILLKFEESINMTRHAS